MMKFCYHKVYGIFGIELEAMASVFTGCYELGHSFTDTRRLRGVTNQERDMPHEETDESVKKTFIALSIDLFPC